jgi:ketosteroid isomerase-like protein
MAEADSQIEQKILELAHEWIEAIRQRDPVSLDKILADDFVITGWLPGGQLADKKFYIEDCLRPIDVEEPSYRYDRWRVRAYGDIAVVNCVFSCHAVVGGHEWGGDFLLTDVWVKENGRWRVVTRHSSPVVPLATE